MPLPASPHYANDQSGDARLADLAGYTLGLNIDSLVDTRLSLWGNDDCHSQDLRR
jgi:hypothetical protein